MPWLSRALPAPVFRYLQRQFGVQEPKDRSESYVDLLVVLHLPGNPPARSLEPLIDLIHEFRKSRPEILRCELHLMPNVDEKSIVYLTLRFSDGHNAPTLTVDGVDFQHWLAMGEDRGLWECAIYEHNITFLAGYDRGGSGRTRLLEERGATANDPAPTTTTLPKQPRRKLSKKKHGTQLDTVQEDIDIELEDMSEVRRGKQPER